MQITPLLRQKWQMVVGLLNNDARHYQLLFLSTFFLTGMLTLHWNLIPYQLLFTFGTAVCTQLVLIKIFKLPITALKSAFISSFSLSLLFKSDMWWVVMLAAFLGIASKGIFKVNKKHFFNPANFGICATIILTHRGWISPGQWGSAGYWWFLIGMLGFIVITSAHRMETAFAFLATYALLFGYRILVYQNWPSDFFFHQFTNGGLLLFTFFMITDPASTPSNKKARIAWAMAVGILAFYLQAYLWVTASPIWALFFLSPLTPAIDYFFKAEKFEWKQTSAKALATN
jgi:Na+-transporting NADH:ubiquinone oxidoreductase subunit NqrB